MSPTAAPLPPADPIRALPPLTDDFDVQDGPGGNHDGIPHRGRGAGEPALRGQFPHQRANSSRRIGHLEREASHLQIAAIDEPEDERLAKRLRPRIDQHHTGAPVRSTAGDVGRDCRGRGRVAYPGLPDKAAPRACGTAGSCGRGVAGLGALATPAGRRRRVGFPKSAGKGRLAVGGDRGRGHAVGRSRRRGSPHGWRSTFRTWASERADADYAVMETTHQRKVSCSATRAMTSATLASELAADPVESVASSPMDRGACTFLARIRQPDFLNKPTHRSVAGANHFPTCLRSCCPLLLQLRRSSTSLSDSSPAILIVRPEGSCMMAAAASSFHS